MSWIGSYHPDQIAGLIYLDAVDSYSFYDPAETDMAMDMVDVRRQIDAFEAGEPLSAEVLRLRPSKAFVRPCLPRPVRVRRTATEPVMAVKVVPEEELAARILEWQWSV